MTPEIRGGVRRVPDGEMGRIATPEPIPDIAAVTG